MNRGPQSAALAADVTMAPISPLAADVALPLRAGWDVLRNVSELHLEITNACNLHCSYCYAEVERPNHELPRFPMAVFRRLMNVIATVSRKPRIEIISHGGEPLLQSADWYDEACAVATETASRANKTCEFGLQSNLTLLREEHVDVFVRHGVKVGTSLDGPEDIHNRIRGRFRQTAESVRRLRVAGVFSGAIAVVHHHNWDHVPDIFQTFHDLGIRAFHLNVASAVGHGMGLTPLTEDQIFRTLKDNFDSMSAWGGEMVETRLLAKLRRHLSPPRADEFLKQLRCDNPFCHAGVNMVIAKPNGELYPCGCAGTSGNVRHHLLGNVLDAGCDAEAYYAQLRRFHKKPEKYERECRTCPARFVCEHGCPAFDMNDPVTPERHCRATKRFREYLDALPRSTLERVAAYEPQPFAPEVSG